MMAYREHRQAIRVHQPTTALIAAAMSCQAIEVITADDHHRPRTLTPLLARRLHPIPHRSKHPRYAGR